ncbi:tetratricopeptide repeat protein [candidate division KSB1 bacterium]
MKKLIKTLKWLGIIFSLLIISSFIVVNVFLVKEKKEPVYEITPEKTAEIESLGKNPLEYVSYVLKDEKINVNYLEFLMGSTNLFAKRGKQEETEKMLEKGMEICLALSPYGQKRTLVDFMLVCDKYEKKDYIRQIYDYMMAYNVIDSPPYNFVIRNVLIKPLLAAGEFDKATEILTWFKDSDYYKYVDLIYAEFKHDTQVQNVITYAETVNDPDSQVFAYFMAADHFLNKGDRVKTLEYLDKAYMSVMQKEREDKKAQFLTEIFRQYMRINEITKAEEVLSTPFLSELEEQNFIAKTAGELALYYCRQNNVQKGMEIIKDAEKILYNSRGFLRDFYINMSAVYAYNGDYEEAVEILEDISNNDFIDTEGQCLLMHVLTEINEMGKMRAVSKMGSDVYSWSLSMPNAMTLSGDPENVKKQIEVYNRMHLKIGIMSHEFPGAYIMAISNGRDIDRKFKGNPIYKNEAFKIYADNIYQLYLDSQKPAFGAFCRDFKVLLSSLIFNSGERIVYSFGHAFSFQTEYRNMFEFVKLLLLTDDYERAFEILHVNKETQYNTAVLQKFIIDIAENNTTLNPAEKDMMQKLLSYLYSDRAKTGS